VFSVSKSSTNESVTGGTSTSQATDVSNWHSSPARVNATYSYSAVTGSPG
jgi:hypothetical protein